MDYKENLRRRNRLLAEVRKLEEELFTMRSKCKHEDTSLIPHEDPHGGWENIITCKKCGMEYCDL